MTHKKRAIALGFFDGVHVGHAALVNKTKERASELGASPAVLTFDVHPETLITGEALPLITSPAGREFILHQYFGVDEVVCIHFSREVMHMYWKDFVLSLKNELDAVALVVGHDFRFGYKGEGTALKLREYGRELGIEVDIIEPVYLEGRIVSSTYIRQLLKEGRIEEANRFLGHPYSLLDTVRHGMRLGRTIGAPTINMRFEDGVLVPRYGVYAAKVFIDGGEYMGVTNIGVRPTVSRENRVSVETYILDFDENVYGKLVRLELHSFLRPERKFGSVEELQECIHLNAEMVRKYFAEGS